MPTTSSYGVSTPSFDATISGKIKIVIIRSALAGVCMGVFELTVNIVNCVNKRIVIIMIMNIIAIVKPCPHWRL